MGRDVGFLPGDLEEKLNPWMKPIFDNLELLITNKDPISDRDDRVPAYQHLIDQKIIEVEPLTYIRGRSIPHQYLIVDEAQNLTPHEVKTVITRAGEGTKIILTGDPRQIDNPYVDATSNGLTYVVERFKNSPLAGHVTLRKGERSKLAEMAAELL
jgi:PhoH-like ATPase